jgi:alpha-glucosidase
VSEAWWRDGVFYQIYPRSFADGNGDGIGDLAGMTAKLDYLEWLGITAVWLNPINPSPNVDWGYDVIDYTDVHPDLGSLADVNRLVADAKARGIRVLLDLVSNHTSDQHPWFHERPELYVWADSVPNNWQAIFGGGSAWTLDPRRGRYYLHNFAKGQPDLDWWNPDVRAEFQRILRFWFERGIAGFRIDVAHGLVKDRELRDDLPASESDDPHTRALGIRRVHSMNRPETHEIFRDWRRIADSFEPPRVLLGEVYVLDIPAWARYYGSGSDELNLAFNFALVHADLDAGQMSAIVAGTEAALPPGAWPCWIGSNHDAGRLTTRWCRDDEALARCSLLMLLTLRGTPSLYYGDELALPAGHVPPERVQDVAVPSRDPCRTPMPWSRAGGWNDPWLPLEDTSRNVEDQRADPASTLQFTRELISLRARTPDLRSGTYEELPSPEGTWIWRRGSGVVVGINLGPSEEVIDGIDGSIALATRRSRDGEQVSGRLRLAPAEGAVVTSTTGAGRSQR